MARQTKSERVIAQLREELDTVRAHTLDLEVEGANARAHIIVLTGDRDALTRTIEVLSRRLASPSADRDPTRGGWRSANQARDVERSR